MGSRLSVSVAELVMDNVEKEFMRECPLEFRPFFYRRYIDDTLCLFHGEDDCQRFLRFVNNFPACGSFSFTMEKEEDSKLPFLDILLARGDHELSTSVYRKPTHSDRYIHPAANLPNSVMGSVINTMRTRALRYCSNDVDLKRELGHIRSAFIKNGHSPATIGRRLAPKPFGPNLQKQQQQQGQPSVTLPFEGPAYRALRGYLQRNGIVVRYFSGSSLGNALYYKDYSTPEKRGVIYKIHCKQCEMSYIGETGRKLAVRLKEHELACRPTSKRKSAVALHCKQTGHSFDFENPVILDNSRYQYTRKLKESFYIHCNESLVNNMSESLPIFNDWSSCLASFITS